MPEENRSEVARLLHQINLEYSASEQALTGYAMVSRHDFITARTENIQICHEQLTKLVGPERAIQLMAETIWSPVERGGNRE